MWCSQGFAPLDHREWLSFGGDFGEDDLIGEAIGTYSGVPYMETRIARQANLVVRHHADDVRTGAWERFSVQ